MLNRAHLGNLIGKIAARLWSGIIQNLFQIYCVDLVDQIMWNSVRYAVGDKSNDHFGFLVLTITGIYCLVHHISVTTLNFKIEVRVRDELVDSCNTQTTHVIRVMLCVGAETMMRVPASVSLTTNITCGVHMRLKQHQSTNLGTRDTKLTCLNNWIYRERMKYFKTHMLGDTDWQ